MLKRSALLLIAFVFLGFHAIAQAELVELEILERTPWAEGREFEGVGAYERVKGRAKFAVDPTLEANKAIVDVELAPRNAEGRVEFSADVEMLMPKDLSKARGTLLYDVNNRGRDRALKMFNGGADEFLMRHGFVIAWSGWLHDVVPDALPNDPHEALQMALLLDAPLALDRRGRNVSSSIEGDIVVDKPCERTNITNRSYLSCYEPAEKGTAFLNWRLRAGDRPIFIHQAQWRLETIWESGGQRLKQPLVELVMPAGLRPGYIYHLVYPGTGEVVQGLGLAGIRDLVSFLRYDTSERNPLRTVVKRTIGDGNSQSGRCLRTMLAQGFNADEEGRQVFDGLMPIVTGGGVLILERFAQPSRFASQHLDHHVSTDAFPFAYGTEIDPVSRQQASLLDRARQQDVVPKIMHIQTSAEYWDRSGSLVHTDPQGESDGEIPPEVRIYAIGGAQHASGDDLTIVQGIGQLPESPLDYRSPLRALLLALDRWIADGMPPPESCYPRFDRSTLNEWSRRNSGNSTSFWFGLPGVRYPEVIQCPVTGTLLKGAEASPYRVSIPACDPIDHNDHGMLRLPPIEVPVATYTGWSLRSREVGAENELVELKGSYIPFARTQAEREATGDPRPSLEELYPTFDDYLAKTQAAAKKLVAEGYLLDEDVPRYVERAKKRRSMFEGK